MMSYLKSCMQRTNRPLITLALFGLMFMGGGMLLTSAEAAVMIVINGDGPGEGFNDPTPYTPGGGNPATTLGQARLNAFKHAANLVGAQITSAVPIVIFAQMNPLGGTATSATLGQAGASSHFKNFTGAPLTNTWYPAALANKLSGTDLTIGTPNGVNPSEDIDATFNSDVDGNLVMGTIHWYYGYDANPPRFPAGTGPQDEDFVSTVMHEIVHGLGFASQYQINTATRQVTKYAFADDVFSSKVEWHRPAGAPWNTVVDFNRLTNTQRFTAITSGNSLHFIGQNTRAAIGMPSWANHVKLFAPAIVQLGSTLSHFDEATYPNEMMSPFATGIQQDLGMAANVLQDIGWGPVGIPQPYASLSATSYAVGSTMTLWINEKAGKAPAVVDKYLALQLPNGSFLYMQPNGGFSTTLNAWKRNYRPASTLSASNAFSYTFTGTSLAGAEPKGMYTWYVAFTTPGTLNIVSLASVNFNVL